MVSHYGLHDALSLQMSWFSFLKVSFLYHQKVINIERSAMTSIKQATI